MILKATRTLRIVTVLLLSSGKRWNRAKKSKSGWFLDFKIQVPEEPGAREADPHPPRARVLIPGDFKKSPLPRAQNQDSAFFRA